MGYDQVLNECTVKVKPERLNELIQKKLNGMSIKKIHHMENFKIFVELKNGNVKQMDVKINLSEPLYGICNDVDYIKELLIKNDEIVLGNEVTIYNLEELCDQIEIPISFTFNQKGEGIIKKVEKNSNFEKWKNLNFPDKKLTNKNFIKKRYYPEYFLYSPITILKLLEYEYCFEKKEYDSEYELGTMDFYLFKSLYSNIFKRVIEYNELDFDNYHLFQSLLNKFNKHDKKGTDSIMEFFNSIKRNKFLV